jgi:hypothetical protein
MVDTNTNYKTYVCKTSLRVQPGSLYYGEKVLQDPRNDVPTDFQAPTLLSLIMRGRNKDEDIVVREYEDVETTGRKEAFLVWKEQDKMFAKKEEDVERRAIKREEANKKAEEENQACIKAWGNNEKWATLPVMKRQALQQFAMISVPSQIKTKALNVKDFDLGHFHLDQMQAYTAKTAGKTKKGMALMLDNKEGVFRLQKQDRVNSIPGVLDMSLSDVVTCGKWYTRALKLWGGQANLHEAWEKFFFHIDNHDLTSTESGREILKQMVKLQWTSFHQAMESSNFQAPDMVQETLESEAHMAWIVRGEEKCNNAMSAFLHSCHFIELTEVLSSLFAPFSLHTWFFPIPLILQLCNDRLDCEYAMSDGGHDHKYAQLIN